MRCQRFPCTAIWKSAIKWSPILHRPVRAAGWKQGDICCTSERGYLPAPLQSGMCLALVWEDCDLLSVWWRALSSGGQGGDDSVKSITVAQACCPSRRLSGLNKKRKDGWIRSNSWPCNPARRPHWRREWSTRMWGVKSLEWISGWTPRFSSSELILEYL